MTAQQLLLASAPIITTSDSSSLATDEVHTTDLLARIAHLSAFLVADNHCGELTPTRRIELAIKLFNLEYRVLVQRNQARKLALQQETPRKQPARRRSHSTAQLVAETDKTNDPVQPAQQLEASAFSDSVALATSFSLEQPSTIDETGETSHDTDELQSATENSPIDTASSDFIGEQTTVSEVTEPEQVCRPLPSSPSDIDQLTEAVNQEAPPPESQNGSQIQTTKTFVIEKKGLARQKGANKKKPSASKKTFPHSGPVKPKRRKR